MLVGTLTKHMLEQIEIGNRIYDTNEKYQKARQELREMQERNFRKYCFETLDKTKNT